MTHLWPSHPHTQHQPIIPNTDSACLYSFTLISSAGVPKSRAGGGQQNPNHAPEHWAHPKSHRRSQAASFKGCWKQLFKIQQPLCLTTCSDLWYFLPKQFICLAQQLINSQGHPSRGLARAGPAAGPDGGCVSGINTILMDCTASGTSCTPGVPTLHPHPKCCPARGRGCS